MVAAGDKIQTKPLNSTQIASMDSRKRKREQYAEGSNSTKRLQLGLSKRYQRARDIPEILSDGANLESGHFCGTLDTVEYKNQMATLMIRDSSKKIIICDIMIRTPSHSLNKGLGKPIQVAVCGPKKIPTAEHKTSQYSQRLLFDKYQFVLRDELFEDMKGQPASFA
jgi:hypothetical protein